MTTSTPPHNLGEIINAEKLLMEFPNATTADLLDIIEGPDFPTGGIVTNKDELLSIYETGRGKIRIRGKAEIVRGKRKSDRDKIVITLLAIIGAGSDWNGLPNSDKGKEKGKGTESGKACKAGTGVPALHCRN